MTTQIAHFRDSVSPELIGTSTCDGVLYYANGLYKWSTAEVNRFIEAGKRVHAVDVNGSAVQHADILDVETFDATPARVPDWVAERWRTHSTAAVYCSRSVVPSVVRALDGLPCYLIVADWTGVPHMPVLELPPRVVVAAVQYANLPGWDEVAVYSRGWLEGARL